MSINVRQVQSSVHRMGRILVLAGKAEDFGIAANIDG
jgi:hypothetical protein